MNHIEFGAAGEDIAVKYLERKGWSIIARNVKVGRGELDIVAEDCGELVIVEVRTRRIGYLSPAETTVGPVKVKRIIKAARTYVDQIAFSGAWRIDVVAVTENDAGELSAELFSDITMGMEGGFMG
ncbi:MAG: YraN family protein [Synergistaceae bacterium]|nr:YraN family protein [Synergistaceae bacterium]